MSCLEKHRRYQKIFCPHCDKEVSKSSWYSHYSQYFDSRSHTWTKSQPNPCPTATNFLDLEEDFDFGSSSDFIDEQMEISASGLEDSNYFLAVKRSSEQGIFFADLSKALTFQSITGDDYQKLIVCPTCHSTYEYDQCLSSGMFTANISVCSFINFLEMISNI